MLTLDIAMITHSPDGIEKVGKVILPPREGVKYVVSWQNHAGAPIPHTLEQRKDVEIHRLDIPGLSANRNNAISHCKADIILLGDDDLTYNPYAFEEICKVFSDNPHLDVATFESNFGDLKRFPKDRLRLTCQLPRNYSVASIEIAFRRASAGNLRCCEEMGLGAKRYHGGEDELLLLSAIKRGMRCEFFPIEICKHPHPSTGTKSRLTKGNLRASGVVIALYYPFSAFLRIPLKAWRVAKSGKSRFFPALLYLGEGALEAPRIRRRNRLALW